MNELNRLVYEAAAREMVWAVLPIVMADMETGEVVYASKFLADIFGYQVDDIVGHPVELLIPEVLRAMHEVWRRDAKVPKTRLMGVGRQVLGRRKDGTEFPAHVGLTAMECAGRTVGIAYVIDLTGIIRQPTPVTPV